MERARVPQGQVRDPGGAAAGDVDGQVGEAEQLAHEALAHDHGLHLGGRHARKRLADDPVLQREELLAAL